jgi:hypothetical protein
MRLEIEDESPVDNPTAGDVRQALLLLDRAGSRWTVLDIRPNYYLQARVAEDGQLIVEYREGGPDRHYRAGGPQPREAVIDAFLDYLAGGNGWRTAFEWRRLEMA